MNETLAEEKDIFDTFHTNLLIAEKEAEGAEEGNAAVLEAINRALQSDPSVAAAVASTPGSTDTSSTVPSAQPDDAPTAAGAMPEF
mgnify:FL=1